MWVTQEMISRFKILTELCQLELLVLYSHDQWCVCVSGKNSFCTDHKQLEQLLSVYNPSWYTYYQTPEKKQTQRISNSSNNVH